jgi:hypothetical protein
MIDETTAAAAAAAAAAAKAKAKAKAAAKPRDQHVNWPLYVYCLYMKSMCLQIVEMKLCKQATAAMQKLGMA